MHEVGSFQIKMVAITGAIKKFHSLHFLEIFPDFV